MANVFYERGWIELVRTDLDLLSDTIRVALVDNTYVPNATTDEFFDDISGEITGGGYTSGGEELANKSIEVDIGSRLGRFKADDITAWNAATFTGARAAVVYKDTGVAATSALLLYIDFSIEKNAPFSLLWNTSGLFAVNSQELVPDQIADLETGALPDGFDTTIGNVSVSVAAALADNYGMEVNTTPGAASYGEQSSGFTNETALTYECLFDPNALTMINTNSFELVSSRGSGPLAVTNRLLYERNAGVQELELRYSNDSSRNIVAGRISPVSDEMHKIRVIWVASSGVGQDDGFILLYHDGVFSIVAEGLDTDLFDIDLIRFGAAGIDVETSGVFYLDNMLWTQEIVFANPLAADYDMPTTMSIGLNATIVNAITFTEILSPLIQQQVIAIGEGVVEIDSPGIAQYKVRLKNQSGEYVAEFDTWRSLVFTHKDNNLGTIRFEMDGEDSRINLFELDGQMEVWRANPIVGLDWYVEWEGFFRSPEDKFFAGDTNSFVANGFNYLDLVRRAEIKWVAGSNQADKSAVGETVIKEYVSENIGAGALLANGRLADNVMPGLIIEGDLGRGTTWSGASADQKLLNTIQKIALATGLSFDIIGNGAAGYQFVVYDGQKTDRTKTNVDSNAPVIFSLGFGNMIVPVLSKNRSREVTAVYALASQATSYELVESIAANDSPWNRVENTIRTSSALAAELVSAGEAELENKKFDPKLTFNILQQKNSYYGKHYTWGDKVTASFKNEDFDKKIVGAQINVSHDVDGEQISIEFADN